MKLVSTAQEIVNVFLAWSQWETLMIADTLLRTAINMPKHADETYLEDL